MVQYAKSVDPELYDVPALLNKDFLSKTGIENFATKFGRIDKFLVSMFQMGLAKDSDAALDPERGGPLSTVGGPHVENLLLYAFEEPPTGAIEAGFLSEDSQMRLKFEALRKLFLLSVLEPASQYYSQVESLGNLNIEKIWNNIFYIDKATQKVPVGEGGADGATRYMRGFKDIEGLLVSQDTRPKEIPSYFRKIILRGFDDPENLWDIYGRSLVLAPDPNAEEEKAQALFARQEFEVETFQMNDEKKISSP